MFECRGKAYIATLAGNSLRFLGKFFGFFKWWSRWIVSRPSKKTEEKPLNSRVRYNLMIFPIRQKTPGGSLDTGILPHSGNS